MSQPALGERPSASGSFSTTHWSLILAAERDVGTRADSALAELCRTYWHSAYAFDRRKGHQPADAQDLTQASFAHRIDSLLVRKANPQKGRFRSFQLGCFTLFLASEVEGARALKRGEGLCMLSIDFHQAVRRFAAEPASTSTPQTAC